MKAKLIKNHYGFEYFLMDENGETITTSDTGKLSKENCDEIFGVVDVDKLFLDCYGHALNKNAIIRHEGFTEGFNKAMELNKDKLFTVEDMKEAYGRGFLQQGIKSFNSLIQSLQQPKEIEVEIEQVLIQSSIQGEAIWEYKLDENDCLILNKL